MRLSRTVFTQLKEEEGQARRVSKPAGWKDGGAEVVSDSREREKAGASRGFCVGCADKHGGGYATNW